MMPTEILRTAAGILMPPERPDSPALRPRGRPPGKQTLPPVEDHVGIRIRLYRRMKGFSQERLGQGLGLTFQQVQKYENGKSRVSVATLCRIAEILEVPIAAFFDDMPHEETPGLALSPLDSRDILQVLQHFQPLPDPVKKQMVALMKVLREEHSETRPPDEDKDGDQG